MFSVSGEPTPLHKMHPSFRFATVGIVGSLHCTMRQPSRNAANALSKELSFINAVVLRTKEALQRKL